MTAFSFIRRPTRQGVPIFDNDLLPWRHFMVPIFAPDIATVPSGAANAYIGGFPLNIVAYGNGSTTAGACRIGWNVYISAGTWSIQWLMDKRNDYGINRCYVDGTAIGSNEDFYAATYVHHRYYPLGVPTSAAGARIGMSLTRGTHSFEMRNTGTKNAASSNYLTVVSGLILTRLS